GKYQEIRSRFADLLWVDYANFLIEDVKDMSTDTEMRIRFDLSYKVHAACQKIEEYNRLLGLAKDNFELFPLKPPDISFRFPRFFSQSRQSHYAGNIRP
ncbi:hypothetical protein NO2_1483, partial [Candidatus Termititenax persephonae]